ncbi:MAG TPA: nitronate monooxygenase [Methylovirgula sp.]|nr:nitronate monooxygenase [Methylovirgula sp.]
MALRTRLTEKFKIEHPIVSAPMGFIAGGRLAAAVTQAGGLGLIGAGYGEPAWLERELDAAGNTRVGCGFITWSLAEKADILPPVLARAPAAVMLSFGAPARFAEQIKAAGVPLICQAQTLAHAREAVAAGADVVVAQGGEAGGHGGSRATFTLTPEIADYLAGNAPDCLLLAAGGIADGRGLAASLMLGADGVLIGSRFMLSAEALTPPGFLAALIAADGDATQKTHVPDIVRGYSWPAEFSGRALKTRFLADWHGRESALADPAMKAKAAERYWRAFRAGEPEETGVFIGEAVGLIRDAPPAATIIARIAQEAERLLAGAGGFLVPV